jgi:hypothetical protein
MRKELADVGKPQTMNGRSAREIIPPQTQHLLSSPASEQHDPQTQDEEWSSASDTEEPSTSSDSNEIKAITPPLEIAGLESTKELDHEHASPMGMANFSISRRSTAQTEVRVQDDGTGQQERHASPQRCAARTPPSIQDPPMQSADSETDLANQILNSVSVSSPSPKKQRHTLSLAERTRLSMSRASHSKYSDLHDDVDNLADLTRLSITTKPSQAAKNNTVQADDEKHADLIERTRKSMAGFEAAQKKAQVERRRSVKDAKKKQRESSYFPKVEEEPLTPSINPVELIEGDPDYESVFKSRPKIKTSPAVSPTRIWEDET